MIRGIAKKYMAIGLVPLFVAIFLVSAMAANAANPGIPSSPPKLPYVHYGLLTIESIPVTDGLVVEALVNGNSCGQPSQTKDGMYVVTVRADESPKWIGCAREGSEIMIRVDGRDIGKAVWHSGQIERQDINIDIENVESLPGKRA